jgi:hypothetical protein
VRAEGRRKSADFLGAADAAALFTEVASGAGSGPPRTGLRPWGDSGSISGSRRIIVARAVACATLIYSFYAGSWNPTLAAKTKTRRGWAPGHFTPPNSRCRVCRCTALSCPRDSILFSDILRLHLGLQTGRSLHTAYAARSGENMRM